MTAPGAPPEGIEEALRRISAGAGFEALRRVLREGSVEERRKAVEVARPVRTRGALEFLIEATGDENAPVRRAAAVALADHLEPIALDPLLALLHDRDLDVRCAAARSLRRFKVDPSVVEALASCLVDAPLPLIAAAVESLGEDVPAEALKNVLVRLPDLGGKAAGRALLALARHAGAAVVPTLVREYQRMPAEVRPHLLQALAAAPSVPGRDFLLRHLKAPEAAERAAAARALGRAYVEGAVVEPLLAALGDAEDAVRDAAAEALGAVGARLPEAVRALATHVQRLAAKRPPPARPEAYKRLERADGEERRIWEAIVLLDRLDRPDLSAACAAAAEENGRPEAVEPLLADLSAEEGALLRSTLRLPVKWQRLQAASALAVAAEAVAERARRRERILAGVEALGRTGSGEAVEALASLFADPDVSIRAAAARTLGVLGARPAGAVLLRGLTDPEGRVRANAAWALGRVGAADAVAALAQAASDEDRWTRSNALLSLDRLGSPSALEAARRAAGDRDPRVRATAAHVLGARGGAEDLALLRAALRDADRRVRSNAAEGVAALLDRLGRPGAEVLEALSEHLDAPDNRVRATVAAVLHPHAPDRALRALDGMIASADVWMRASAAWALGEIGTAEAAPRLAALLADADPRVRSHAVRGLARVRGPGALEAARAALASLGAETLHAATGAADEEGHGEAARAVASMAVDAP